MFGPKGPFCQSCGMPMAKDPDGGGTETDGSKSSVYCSHCYQLGAFTEPNLTLDQMQMKVMDKMRQLHVPQFAARRFTKNMPSLARWRNT